jgi:hypothetical protein
MLPASRRPDLCTKEAAMKMCSGRWRVALGLGAALAIASGFTPNVRAGERGKPVFPWQKKPAASTPIPRAAPRSDIAVLPEALTIEDGDDLSPVLQTEPPKPPASSTGQVPSPPPPLQKPAGEPALPPGSFAPPANQLTPVPVGEVLGGPISGEMLQGDPYPLFYRDRPVGSRAQQAVIISNNRGSEHDWYKEWRCKHYGYYPTQWRPWPEGWHVGRNIQMSPQHGIVHPYDLKQPDPEYPEGKRPATPKGLQEQGRDAKGPTPNPNRPQDSGPPLKNTPTDQKTDQQKKGP